MTLIKIHTKENKLDLTESEWNILADKTEGYSGSDIANMTLGALFGPIRDLQTAQYWGKTQGRFIVFKHRISIDMLYFKKYSVSQFYVWLFYLNSLTIESL